MLLEDVTVVFLLLDAIFTTQNRGALDQNKFSQRTETTYPRRQTTKTVSRNAAKVRKRDFGHVTDDINKATPTQ